MGPRIGWIIGALMWCAVWWGGPAAAQDAGAARLEDSRRAFAQVIVTSPVLEKEEHGSGVLITREGHILTAWHVIRRALDDESEELDPLPRLGAGVFVQFLADGQELDKMRYPANIIRYSAKDDVALLRVALPPAVLAARHVAVLNYAAAQLDCDHQCLRVFGVTSRGFVQELATPGQPIAKGGSRQLTSNITFGFSGGPVFYMGRDSWPLVGIALSGDRLQQATNFIASIHAANTVLDPIREELSVEGNVHFFPTQRFLDWAQTPAFGEAAVPVLLKGRLQSDPGDFVQYVVAENFSRVKPEVEKPGRLLLEMSLPELRRQTRRVEWHGLITSKLVGFYRVAKVDGAQRARRWVEDAAAHREYCGAIAKGGQGDDVRRCWARANLKNEMLWRSRVSVEYHAATARYWETEDEAERAKLAAWADVASNHLIEWAQLLSEIASKGTVETFTLMERDFGWPATIGTSAPPGRDDSPSPRAWFRHAALDKYRQLKEVLANMVEARAQSNPLRLLWCNKIKEEISSVQGLVRLGGEYDRSVGTLLVNGVEPHCK